MRPLMRSISSTVAMVLIPAVCLPACRHQLEPIFEPMQAGPAWPEPPAAARIRYLGQLRTSKDLKPAPKPFEELGDLLLGPREPAPMYGPRAAVCTPDGEHLWVADPGGRCLHLFDLKERTYRKIVRAGERALLAPVGVSLGPHRTVYVCDSEDVAVHVFDASTGRFIESLPLPEVIRRPVDLAYDESADALYVVDVSAHDVKVLSADGALRGVIGRRGGGPGELNFPSAIALHGDTLWVADTGNQRVQALARDGTPLGSFGGAGDAPGDLALPKGVACDREGNVYVVDGRFENVQVFDAKGRLLLVFGQEGTGPGEFWLPGGISIDAQYRIWVCDAYNRRVQVFQRMFDTLEIDDGAGE